jgi:hypothetical protein
LQRKYETERGAAKNKKSHKQEGNDNEQMNKGKERMTVANEAARPESRERGH